MLFWSTIVGVVIGGSISLATIWWIAPLVTRRERKEQRREDALLNLQSAAQLILNEYPRRLAGPCLVIMLSAPVPVESKHPASPQTEEKLRLVEEQFSEVRKCLDVLQQATDSFLQDVLSLPTWVARIGDVEIDEAWAQIISTIRAFRRITFAEDIGEKIELVFDANNRLLPALAGSIGSMIERPLVLLGHRGLGETRSINL